VTVALALVMGTGHWLPVLFQYSSMRSLKPLRAPGTVYRMT
jgi:hypothetical protein